MADSSGGNTAKEKHIKIYIVIDIKAKGIFAMSITTDETYDSREDSRTYQES